MKRVRKKQPYRRKKPVDLPRRALSAYNLFFRDERGKIMEEQKLAGLASTSTFGALGKAVADRWKNMTPEEHSRYKQLAAEDKIRYNREMEQYKANALSVHQLRTEEGRLAGEMMHASVGYPNRYSSPQFRLGSTMLRQPHDTGFSMAQANPTPFAAAAADASNLSLRDAAGLLADIQNPLELSLLLGAQDCSLSLYSRLLASQQYGNAHVPLGASSLDSLGAQQQAPLLLNHHLAWAKAERDLQVEQATQQLYQSAMASQQLQLLTAQQSAFASTAAGATQPPPNYFAMLLGSSANQSPLPNATADCVPGKIVLDDAQEQGDAAATINPLLRHYLRQAQQNRESVKATSSIGADALGKFSNLPWR
ncbi:hypothetical protein MPSEU_000319500 [Mayamaea pseudoterrestris]|nr:hypothetical protein MPSEU_000319500 [Mayamaea pseudoterrestris]